MINDIHFWCGVISGVIMMSSILVIIYCTQCFIENGPREEIPMTKEEKSEYIKNNGWGLW